MSDNWDEAIIELELRGDISSKEIKIYAMNDIDLQDINYDDFDKYWCWKSNYDPLVKKLYKLQGDLVTDGTEDEWDYIREQLNRLEAKIDKDFQNLLKAEKARRENK